MSASIATFSQDIEMDGSSQKRMCIDIAGKIRLVLEQFLVDAFNTAKTSIEAINDEHSREVMTKNIHYTMDGMLEDQKKYFLPLLNAQAIESLLEFDFSLSTFSDY